MTVADTSPLIVLGRLNRLDILKALQQFPQLPHHSVAEAVAGIAVGTLHSKVETFGLRTALQGTSAAIC